MQTGSNCQMQITSLASVPVLIKLALSTSAMWATKERTVVGPAWSMSNVSCDFWRRPQYASATGIPVYSSSKWLLMKWRKQSTTSEPALPLDPRMKRKKWVCPTAMLEIRLWATLMVLWPLQSKRYMKMKYQFIGHLPVQNGCVRMGHGGMPVTVLQ